MERTTIFLPLELKLSINAAAKRTGSLETEVIRGALTKQLAEPQFQRPRPKSIGIVNSGRIQSDQPEEWLEES